MNVEQRAMAHIGCSGWSYPTWRGRFYHEELPARRWFEHYAATFDAVELNNTFYRLPTPTAVEGWHDAAPEGFTFALKLGAAVHPSAILRARSDRKPVMNGLIDDLCRAGVLAAAR